MKEYLINQFHILKKRPAFYLFIFTIVILIAFLYKLNELNILPFKYIFILSAGAVLLLIASFFCWYKFHDVVIQISLAKVVTVIICTTLCIVSCLGFYYINSVVDALNKITNGVSKSERTICVYALSKGSIQKTKDLKGRTIGVLNNSSRDRVDECLKELGVEVNVVEYTSTISMVNDFKGQKIHCICVESTLLYTIEDYEEYANIENEIQSIYSYSYEVDNTLTADKVDVTTQPFTVLISGIDTLSDSFSDPDQRSDVNMVVTVNPETKEVIIISIPRDYYVPMVCSAGDTCPNGQKDKLTHTGWHGIGTTEKTIESFLDININYNVKVKYKTVTTIVDMLGGIDVYSSQAIEKDLGNGPSACSVKVGENHLNGECALAFARERYAYADGDRQRIKNQAQVMTAILEKLISPSSLRNFSNIMSKMADFIQTNMSMDEITSIVNKQLTEGGSWHISLYSLDGTDANGFSYEIQDNAYVMNPDESTIDKARKDINSVINGETPPFKIKDLTIG